MIAAIILAAGSSTRMGLDATAGDVLSKALLPLGSRTAIERVVGSVREAGVEEILVVTGHGADHLAPVIDGLGVRYAYNAGHLTGMFSSVLTGVSALGSDVDAFFVLPVDCALIRPEVMNQLVRSHVEAGGRPGTIFHPTCCGRRGHPPLVPARLVDEIQAAGGADGLRGLLLGHEDESIEVEVCDLTILMDMDTRADYERLTRIAAFSPTLDDCRYLRSLLSPLDDLVAHTETVADVGTRLAQAVHERAPELEVQLVTSACLLHDIAKGQRKHAAVGQQLLTKLGLPRLGEVVGAHMVLPPDKSDTPALNEEQLVYLADKLVVGDRVTGLPARTGRALYEQRHSMEAMQGAKARMETALAIARRAEALLGCPLEDAILELRAGAPNG
jgi:molybdenum cofactor cytidylyltransferase